MPDNFVTVTHIYACPVCGREDKESSYTERVKVESVDEVGDWDQYHDSYDWCVEWEGLYG